MSRDFGLVLAVFSTLSLFKLFLTDLEMVLTATPQYKARDVV